MALLMKHCPQTKPNWADIVLTESDLAAIYQLSSTHIRVFVLMRDRVPRDIQNYLNQKIAPQLPGLFNITCIDL